jgi:hypothetical protein
MFREGRGATRHGQDQGLRARLPRLRRSCGLALLVAFTPLGAAGSATTAPAPQVSPPAAVSAGPAGPPAEPAKPPPTKVDVGVYVIQIPSMNPKEHRFDIDFYIWFRWSGDALKPHETFELANGRILSKKLLEKKVVKGGQNYAVLRCFATMTKFWDVSRFPLDDHELELQVEDSVSEEHIQVYVPDQENSTISQELRTPGWQVSGFRTTQGVKLYKTNYGDTTLPKGAESRYSRFVMSVKLERVGIGAFFKLFFPLYVAVCIALLSFMVLASDPGPRLGFAVGAIFASVGASYSIAAALPATTVFTLAERINVLTVGTVFLALLGNVYSVRLFKKSADLSRSIRLDRWWVVMAAIFYVVGNVVVLQV